MQLHQLNPEQPADVILRFLSNGVQPYLNQALDAVFRRGGSPFSNLRKFVKRTSGQLAVSLTAAGAAGGATSAAAIWKASLRMPRWMGYQLGLVSLPLATPLVGGFVGLLLGAGGAAYLIARLRKAEVETIAALHAQTLSVMLHAEGVAPEFRESKLEECKDRLVGAGLRSQLVESLFARAPWRVEELELSTDDYDRETLKTVLTCVFQLLHEGGEIPAASEKVFQRLCRRFRLGDEMTAIESEARAALEKESARIGAALEAARHLGADFKEDTIQEALDQLVAIDPTANLSVKRIKALHVSSTLLAAASAVAAAATGRGRLLPIIGQAYAVLHTAVSGDEENRERLSAKALELLKHLGVKAEDANRFLPPLIETLDALRTDARARTEAVS